MTDAAGAGRTVGVIGVPTSAGAFAPGQEQAPRELRRAGLTRALARHGATVHDHGDRERWRWRPDRGRPDAQNVPAVLEIVTDTARRVREARLTGELTVVLGGDCTVGIGAVAGHLGDDASVGLIYFDAHADLNVPASVSEGALDWMGMAHMLAQPGTVAELSEAGPRTPMLAPEQVIVLGWDPASATRHERETIERTGLAIIPAAEVRADPARAAGRARAALEERFDRLLVHFDVDVIDFTDVPMSENWGRNEGVAYADAIGALAVLLASPKLAGVTITELNPDHVEVGAGTLPRFAEDLARCLAATEGEQATPPAGSGAAAAVRRAGPADAPEIGRLLHDFNTEYDDVTPGPGALAERMRELMPGGETAVLLTGDPPHGIVVLRYQPSLYSRARECYLAELYVAPAHRGEGGGSALLAAAIELARAEGADYMFLGTSVDDVAARALYERFGFVDTEGPGGPAAIVYEREL
jgi:arginase